MGEQSGQRRGRNRCRRQAGEFANAGGLGTSGPAISACNAGTRRLARFYWGIYRLPDSLIGGWKRWPFNGWPGLAMLQIRVLEYLQSFGISELYFYQDLTTRRLD